MVVVVECCDVLEISELVVLDFYAYFCTRIPGRMSTVINRSVVGLFLKFKNWWIGNAAYAIEFVGNN